MKNRTQAFFVFMALLVMESAVCAETPSLKGRVYLSPFYGQYHLEEDPASHRVGGLRGGAFLSDHLIVEGWLAYLNDKTMAPAGDRGGLYLHRVDGLYLPWEPWEYGMARPFLAAGVGGIPLDLDEGNEFGFATDWGMGVDFLLPQLWGIYPTVRADARYLIRSLRGEVLTGTEFTAGVSFQWKPARKRPPSEIEKGEAVTLPEITPEVVTALEKREDIELDAFGLNSAILSTSQKRLLDNLIRVLEGHPESMFELTGHTDNLGTEPFNRGLSHRRALAVKEYLMKKGILPLRMVLVDAGELKPRESNLTEEGRAKNRRVTLRVLQPQEMGPIPSR
jgi:outer membrane protein OmpA-like peptidoglycan-associated protein